MANKRIRQLTTQGTYSDAYYVAVEDASGFIEAKKMTLAVLTGTEKSAREAQDNVIEAGCGLNANGTYTAPANSWYSRNAEFTAGCTDRGGATGALTANIYNSIRLLDAKIYTLDMWEKGSGTSAVEQGIGLNTASGDYSLAAGNGTTASGLKSFAFGNTCVASGDYAAAVGDDSTAAGEDSFAAASGDASNSKSVAFAKADADADYSFAHGLYVRTTGTGAVAMGAGQAALPTIRRVMASGSYSFNLSRVSTSYGAAQVGAGGDGSGIFSGMDNETLGDYSAILSGYNNKIDADGDFSIVIAGVGSHSYIPYSFCNSSGMALANKRGSSQQTEFVIYGLTTDNTPTILGVGGMSVNSIFIPEDSSVEFQIHIIASETGGVSGVKGDSFSQKINGAIKNVGGTTALIGSVNEETPIKDAGFSEADPIAVTADDVTDALQIQVTGAVATNTTWVARVHLTMVGYGNFDLG